MATKYEPVKVATIDQGQFLDDAEVAFEKVQKKVIEAAAKNGTAAGEVTLKIKINADGGGAYKLTTNVAEKLPTKPARVTTAFVNDLGDGTECLFSQSGGTTTGDPKQTQLFNAAGSDDGSEVEQPADATT